MATKDSIIEGINEAIQTNNLNKDWNQLLCINSSDLKDYPHYKLNRRISSTKLLSKFIKLVETAQKCFIEKINEAKELLIDNAVSCRLFDDELQDSDCSNYSSEDTLPPIEKLKDGTWKKICPILKCNRRVFKLGRHLTDIHSELSEEQRAHAKNIAQVIAKRIAADDPTTPCSSYTKKNPAIKGQQREYRNCFICGKLYLNIPDHLKKTHKLDKESLQYQTATLKSTVVPNKFITTSSGKPEMMNTFTEIEEMYPERTTKQELYAIKTEIIECTNKINTAAADEEQSEISEKLSKLKEKYKLIRYGDKRIYSSESMTWRTRFTAYLERKKYKNVARMVNSAFDVFLGYEKNNKHVKYNDLLDVHIIRKILLNFSEGNVSTPSQIKYIYNFKMLIKFLTLNIDSPEYQRISQLPLELRGDIDLKFRTVMAEIEDHLSSLNKNKGKALMVTKDKAKSKLVDQEEMSELTTRIRNQIETFVNDYKNNKLDNYSHRDNLRVRDHLIACGTKNIPRRSLEMMMMTLTEVKNAERKVENGRDCYVVEVSDQKTQNTGEKAAIVYDVTDFEALQIFISEIRPKILAGRKSTKVFPTSKSILNSSSDADKSELSFSNTNRIMSNFTTKKGKKLSTRVIRQSCITHSRRSNASQEQRICLAKAMNHSIGTADRHYDFSGVSEAAVKSLDLTKSWSDNSVKQRENCSNSSEEALQECPQGSSSSASFITKIQCSKDEATDLSNTVESPFQDAELIDESQLKEEESDIINECSTISDISGEIKGILKTRTNSTPQKRRVSFISSSDDEVDITLKNLRSKKIKYNPNDNLKSVIFEILNKFDKTTLNSLISSRGLLRVKPITDKLPASTRYSIKEVRKIIKDFMKI